jgi:hypothetical protein
VFVGPVMVLVIFGNRLCSWLFLFSFFFSFIFFLLFFIFDCYTFNFTVLVSCGAATQIP